MAARGGFPTREHHWRFGQESLGLKKQFRYGMSVIYEMVINSNPCYLYCLHSNTLVDNITVIAHALGHCHFFKNNVFFEPTQRFARDYNMINELANHGNRIREYMTRWGKEKVTEFIDHILRIDTLIDPSSAWDEKEARDVVIRDTRKTVPGLRAAQKYAVRCGGGQNHRMGLGDQALIKDNHVVAAGGVVPALRAVRALRPDIACEVECTLPEQVEQACADGATLVLLDNMTLEATRESVAIARRFGTRTESSGGLRLDNAAEVASTGVDYLAVGALTHSAPTLDIALDLR